VIGGLLFTKVGNNDVFVLALSIILPDVVLWLTLVERSKTRKLLPVSASGHGDSGPMSVFAEAQAPGPHATCS
jgi:hypothetical protein